MALRDLLGQGMGSVGRRLRLDNIRTILYDPDTRVMACKDETGDVQTVEHIDKITCMSGPVDYIELRSVRTLFESHEQAITFTEPVHVVVVFNNAEVQ